MRHFEKIIGEEFLTINIENNEYSYQKAFKKNKKLSREEIAKILGKQKQDKLNKNLDRRFYNHGVAVLVEKKQGQNISKYKEQLENYIKLEKAIGTKNIVGILYDVETGEFICLTHPKETSFQSMKYYEGLFEIKVKKEDVYITVQSINNKLHKLGLSNLVSRMMFTGLALVGLRIAKEEKINVPTTTFDDMKNSLSSIIKNKIPTNLVHKDAKLNLLSDEFSKISLNESNEKDVQEIYEDIDKISEWINSYSWEGKDAMAIFFNEFRRYAKKSEHGQVFTPEIWTDLMYKLIGVNYTSRVLDAACGSGTFLTKSMSKMIKEKRTSEKSIKENNLFGIEWAKELYVLACVNMLMHKDGKSNIIQQDSTKEETGEWIEEQKINKVLMNPPFEGQTGIKIVKNVLDNVEENSLCAFILPDRTLYSKSSKIVNGILSRHTLEKIIKMPDKVWAGIAGTTTSIFIFRTGKPHANKDIIKYWIKEDELVTVKNGGRQDVNDKWIDDGSDNLLKYWTDIINNTREHKTKQVSKNLEYLVPQKDISLTEEDFQKVVLDRILFENPEIKEKVSEIKEKVSEIKEKDWLLWAIREKSKMEDKK
ncbi:SAM-dependent DNA methyltransferase [Candidatus Bathyarchaeota archaeon]|nr:SAM-dependent DNA methyltransferase [Candidatus Bathyarchaeota archaeon]